MFITILNVLHFSLENICMINNYDVLIAIIIEFLAKTELTSRLLKQRYGTKSTQKSRENHALGSEWHGAI